MSVPLSQMASISSYIIRRKIAGQKRYPLVLMLEPLFRCNLHCAGCGKIQYPTHLLRTELTPEQCLRAADECGAPVVSIAGGEPLLHPRIEEIVKGLIDRKKWIYLCSNAVILKQELEKGRLTPDKHLVLSLHMDGLREHHDFAVCREGVFDKAVEAIRLAVKMGFRVTTNTTLFVGTDPNATREFFDMMMDLGVESMAISPGYSYDAAADQSGFMQREQTRRLFRMLLSNRSKRWRFNQSPLFLEFLMGKRDYDCAPWGNPTYNLFGWQVPCYLLQDGYVDTFSELMELTRWENYGRKSGNPRCQSCMVHSGYEAAAVADTFSGIKGLFSTVRAMLSSNEDPEQLKQLQETPRVGPGQLVELRIGDAVSGAETKKAGINNKSRQKAGASV
ncbi:MAG TPA: adenosyl-hopene transferase HpnH [Phycisphaeraceae bacterium]|nr:adenosyl-hopene transferase HpnH [Phycisphaeraceae bacterium]